MSSGVQENAYETTIPGDKKPWFVVFADFHGVNISTWLISSYQPDSTKHGLVQEEMCSSTLYSTYTILIQ